MKRKLLPLLLALPFIANAQFSQNFDASTTLPTGWKVLNGGDTNTFAIGPAAGVETSRPNAVYIGYSADAHDDYFITPAITVTAGVNDRITYFVKNQDPLYVENYDVKISTTNNTSAAAFTITAVPNAPAPSVWTPLSIDLTAYVGQTIYVGFHATSADMFRLLFDDIVNDTAPTTVPGCATATSPANHAIDVNYAATVLNWTPPSTGGKVSYYEIFMGTSPNPTTSVGKFTGSTATLSTDLLGSTKYYWKVIATNSAGQAISCTESDFTTKTDPYSPYCGPLTYSSGVEPITSVALSDMTNTSPAATTSPAHEVFTNKVAKLEQGKTYPITLKGNTGGSYTDRFMVFIDWNQNGVFTDAGETYFDATSLSITNSSGTDAVQAVGNIAVPAGAKLGNTRMRIKKNFGSTAYPNPCFSAGTLATGATTGFGQAEDYTITVIEPQLAVGDVSNLKTQIYPNPVKDVLNISLADKKDSQVSLFSMDGKLVKQQNMTSSNEKLDMRNLKSGVYLVKIKSSDKEETYKVIKE